MDRSIEKVFTLKPTIEGAGVRLRRGFGFFEVPQFDPFLLFDDFSGEHEEDYEAGFPWHPHRGIETVTYMLKGSVAHKDSIGNEGVIEAGDLQWMSAGSGIVHQEMPQVNPEGIMGFQLWVNLPARHKMSRPAYQEIKAAQVPMVTHEGVKVKVIAGVFNETKGPVADIAGSPLYLDIELDAESVFSVPIPVSQNAFVYTFEGDLVWSAGESEQWLRKGAIALLSSGDVLRVSAGREGARFLLVAGEPLKEPVAWRGPVVMNTDEEIAQAWHELETGTFIKQ